MGPRGGSQGDSKVLRQLDRDAVAPQQIWPGGVASLRGVDGREPLCGLAIRGFVAVVAALASSGTTIATGDGSYLWRE